MSGVAYDVRLAVYIGSKHGVSDSGLTAKQQSKPVTASVCDALRRYQA
jgi:hypothetical protein